MLFGPDLYVVILGASGITILMLAALGTHIKIKNPFYKMLPALCLMVISSLINLFSIQLILQ